MKVIQFTNDMVSFKNQLEPSIYNVYISKYWVFTIVDTY